MKNIIINADDFGISHAANQAIVELYQKGALSSTTLMTTLGRSSQEAMQLAKQYNIAIGLHFNLTLQNSVFANRSAFEKAYITGRISKAYIQEELARQWQQLIDAGLQPTHIDSHQHIHTWPMAFRIVAKFAKQHNVAVRLPLEYPILNGQKISFKVIKHLIRKSFLLILGLIDLGYATITKVRTNTKLISIFALFPRPEKLTLEQLSTVLKAARHHTEYMCHPITEAKDTKTSITNYSIKEYHLMTEPAFLAIIEQEKCKLINFGGL